MSSSAKPTSTSSEMKARWAHAPPDQFSAPARNGRRPRGCAYCPRASSARVKNGPAAATRNGPVLAGPERPPAHALAATIAGRSAMRRSARAVWPARRALAQLDRIPACGDLVIMTVVDREMGGVPSTGRPDRGRPRHDHDQRRREPDLRGQRSDVVGPAGPRTSTALIAPALARPSRGRCSPPRSRSRARWRRGPGSRQ